MLNMTELNEKYDVDQIGLGYTQHYETLFDGIREDVTKVLEIGVETGRSHRMWLEYFPNATIYGFDVMNENDRSGYVKEFHELQEGNPNLDRSVIFEGDQENIDDLNKLD